MSILNKLNNFRKKMTFEQNLIKTKFKKSISRLNREIRVDPLEKDFPNQKQKKMIFR